MIVKEEKSELKFSLVCLFSIFLFLIVVNFISAAVDTQMVDDVFKINSIIDYSKPCRDNESYCSPTTTCNFTVRDAEHISRLENAVATYNATIGEANVSINFDKIGLWSIDMTCCDGGRGCGSRTLFADVSGSGFNENVGFYVIILILSLGIVIFGLWKEDAIITLLGSFGLYFLGLYILFNGIGGLKDKFLTYGIGIIILGLAFYISARSAHELITGAD